MPSLKHFRNRIASVKSTRKITSAMKMVAASKLKNAQEQQLKGQTYAKSINKMVDRIVKEVRSDEKLHLFPLLNDVVENPNHLLIVVTSDRGLCGGFNGNLVREAKREIAKLQEAGKTVQLLCIGRKGRDLLKADYIDLMMGFYDDIGSSVVEFSTAANIAETVLQNHADESIGSCSVLYNRFVNALTQTPTLKQVVPCVFSEKPEEEEIEENVKDVFDSVYRFEPEMMALFAKLLPQYVASMIYSTLLDSAAGEHSARMNAMDNATKNAGEMIDRLTVQYNRARQANITGELIEIISAMEAM